MSKPNNAIAAIRLPGDASNVKRPIVPYYVGVSENNNYVATLPSNLNSDAQIIINKTDQGITGLKSFWTGLRSPYIYLYNNDTDDDILIGNYDGYFRFYDGAYDSEWTFYTDSNNAYIEFANGSGIAYGYNFPSASGTLSLQIDIVDLTSL